MNRKTAPLPDHLHFVSCLSIEEVVNCLIWIQHPPVAEMQQRINNYSMTRVWIAVDIVTIIIIIIKKFITFYSYLFLGLSLLFLSLFNWWITKQVTFIFFVIIATKKINLLCRQCILFYCIYKREIITINKVLRINKSKISTLFQTKTLN